MSKPKRRQVAARPAASSTRDAPDTDAIAGVILCGGSGTRMGRTRAHKVCVPMAGRPAVVRLIDTLRTEGVDPLVVVVGDRAGDVVETIDITFPVHHYVAIIKLRGKILISDQREGRFWALGADGKGTYHDNVKDIRMAFAMPDFMSACGDEVWKLSGVWFDGVMRTNAERELLDWGEAPFGHAGIAYDGKQLWALDRSGKRICVVEKTESGRELARA